MKKFIKGRWFPLAIAAIIVAALIIFLGCIGFRITYNPALESSWEAVSAVAAWAGVITSFAAIVTAVWIPKKIAEQQNKIALFEKRYALYNTVCSCMQVAKLISERTQNINEAYQGCWQILGGYYFTGEDKSKTQDMSDWLRCHPAAMVAIDKMRESNFLFSTKTKRFTEELVEIWRDIFNVYTPFMKKCEYDNIKKKFSALCTQFERGGIRDEIEKVLDLQEM